MHRHGSGPDVLEDVSGDTGVPRGDAAVGLDLGGPMLVKIVGSCTKDVQCYAWHMNCGTLGGSLEHGPDQSRFNLGQPGRTHISGVSGHAKTQVRHSQVL